MAQRSYPSFAQFTSCQWLQREIATSSRGILPANQMLTLTLVHYTYRQRDNCNRFSPSNGNIKQSTVQQLPHVRTCPSVLKMINQSLTMYQAIANVHVLSTRSSVTHDALYNIQLSLHINLDRFIAKIITLSWSSVDVWFKEEGDPLPKRTVFLSLTTFSVNS